jgi:hypothetical protein
LVQAIFDGAPLTIGLVRGDYAQKPNACADRQTGADVAAPVSATTAAAEALSTATAAGPLPTATAATDAVAAAAAATDTVAAATTATNSLCRAATAGADVPPHFALHFDQQGVDRRSGQTLTYRRAERRRHGRRKRKDSAGQRSDQ